MRTPEHYCENNSLALACSLGTRLAKSGCYLSSQVGSEDLIIAGLLFNHHGSGCATQGAKWRSGEMDEYNALVRKCAQRQHVDDVRNSVRILHNALAV